MKGDVRIQTVDPVLTSIRIFNSYKKITGKVVIKELEVEMLIG